MNNVTLILTCCVNPNIENPVHAGTPSLRETQYRNAITWYLENTNYNVIVAENSGTDLSNNFNSYRNRCEFLTYQDDGKNRDKGKGFKEMEIIEYVFHHSRLLATRGG